MCAHRQRQQRARYVIIRMRIAAWIMSHTYTRSVYIHRPSLLFSCPSLLCIRSFWFSSNAKHSTVKCLCMCNVESRTMQTGKCVCVCAVERFDCIHKRRLYCIHSYVCQVTKQIFRVARLFCTKSIQAFDRLCVSMCVWVWIAAVLLSANIQDIWMLCYLLCLCVPCTVYNMKSIT